MNQASQSDLPPKAWIVMGVAGSGKSTIGQKLASALGLPFADGDDYHPSTNVEKMAKGTPLNDEDRAPWLARLRELIDEHVAQGEGLVLAASALKKSYRYQLGLPRDGVQLIHLEGDFDLLHERIQARSAHFMPASLLDDQLATLEAPSREEAWIFNVKNPPEEIIAQALERWESASGE